MEDKIPQSAIDSIAQHINQRTNKSYNIPTIGNPSNIETPQIFEILPFDEIDDADMQVYSIDGSKNSHSFYNGVSIGLYRGGYICFYRGKQIRLNNLDDPVIFGRSYTPQNLLVTCNEHLLAIYDELLTLPPVKGFLKFIGAKPEEIFTLKRDIICQSLSNVLGFCQDVLEWALIYEVAKSDKIKAGDLILRDGALRTPYIDQKYLVKLGKFISQERNLFLVGVTKNSPVKVELSYTFRQIDAHLQDKLKPQYPFIQKDPKRQKLCCWFEVPDSVLEYAYSGDMFAKKTLTGGRGIGLFFAARLDYVEKLQNFDWVICDVNIFNAVPGIEQNNFKRDYDKLKVLFYNLTHFTQEHYILGYPYPLVEVHNFVTLTVDFKEEVINRVKHSLYSTQHMDHIDIENMFLDIHSRF